MTAAAAGLDPSLDVWWAALEMSVGLCEPARGLLQTSFSEWCRLMRGER